MIGYMRDIELKMEWLYATLSEKDRRRYAAIEVAKLGHGGTQYIANLFDIDPKTIRHGLSEFELPDDPAQGRIRKGGAGRKDVIESSATLQENFAKILAEFTAGDPMREGVLWTNLSRREISRRLREMGTPASRHVVRKLLKKSDLGQRTARKKKSMGAHPDRNAQFEKISQLKAQYLANKEPVISIDTKKKELIGNFSRGGHTHTQVPVDTHDHDFPSAGDGKLIPHGIYDLARNEGYMNLNLSSDTSEFCCDSVEHWWVNHGVKNYPKAHRVLLLCDGGAAMLRIGMSSSKRYKDSLIVSGWRYA